MLTGKQRHFLRGLGHGLKPVVQIGKGGIDDGLLSAVDRALTDHELIKLKVGGEAGVDRHEAADAIAAKTKSDVAQVLGYVVLLYRARPEQPTIELPSKTSKGHARPEPKPVPKFASKKAALLARKPKPRSQRDRRTD